MIDNGLWETAVDLQQYLQSVGFEFCFIGGIVLQRWGEPRMTSDVDATVLVSFGAEKEFAIEILKRYQSRVEQPITFAQQARILLLQDLQGNRIDLSIGGMPFESRMMQRSSEWAITGKKSIRTCSAEDLIVLKAFASRPQDWIDIRNVLIRQSTKLDRELIMNELRPLAELKEEPELVEHLEQILLNLHLS